MAESHKFYSVSAPAGSGKTFALAQHAVDLAHNHQKVLIVQPTKQLIRETWKAIKRNDPALRVTSIMSANIGTSNVLSQVIAHMAQAEHGKGEVLLVTHEILDRMPDTYRQFWHLFIDEMPSGFDAHHLQIALTHSHATEHLTAERELTGDVVVVDAKNEGALRDLLANVTGDSGLAVFHDLAGDVLNPDKIVCVSKPSYERLIDPTGVEKVTSFFSILTPSFLDNFASVTIMGANLESTELYLLWEKLLNVVWSKHPVLNRALRYDAHENGHRLTIKYLLNGNWSKYHAARPHGSGTILDAVTQAIEAELGDDFLWQANKSVDDNQFEEGIRLPTKAHGQNRARFMKCDNVALVMAVNHAKPASDFLKLIGFSQDEIKTVLQYQNEYQAMMRCSLRDPEATAPVTVCVVSKGSADWLAARFPGCQIERLITDVPEPQPIGAPVTRGYASNGEKQKAYRDRKRAAKDALEARLLAASLKDASSL
jgi:hypothetical protein